MTQQSSKQIDLDGTEQVADTTLAKLAGVSARRIRQLTEAGILERVTRGRYELGQSIRAMMDDAADNASELQRERTRKTRADADLAELKFAEAKKLIAPVEHLEQALTTGFVLMRERVRQLPQRVVTQIVGNTDEREIKNALLREIDLILTEAYESSESDFDNRMNGVIENDSDERLA